MLSTFFKTKPVVDGASREWIFDTFTWCMDELDGDFFQNNSELILPNNTYYPGSSSSVEEMAETIFASTIKYAGMTSWPITLVPAERFTQKPMPQLIFESRLRGENCKISAFEYFNISDDSNVIKNNDKIFPTIDIAFHQSQLNQPQDLIAYLVQNQANILVTQHEHVAIGPKKSAPGGKNVQPQTIDLVACFMGFGVIFANTAYQFKGGCGSCNNSNLNRKSALPELETVYALALFCVVKNYGIKQVKKELKSHLYKPFRQAHKEILLYLQETSNPAHSQLK